jgi:hypothetical protein
VAMAYYRFRKWGGIGMNVSASWKTSIKSFTQSLISI